MNKKQEDLIASGLYLLIKSSDKLRDSEKRVWINDFDELFAEEEKEPTLAERTHDALSEDVKVSNDEVKDGLD